MSRKKKYLTAESEELSYLKDSGVLVHHVLAVGVEQALELGGHHVHPAQGAHRQHRGIHQVPIQIVSGVPVFYI